MPQQGRHEEENARTQLGHSRENVGIRQVPAEAAPPPRDAVADQADGAGENAPPQIPLK